MKITVRLSDVLTAEIDRIAVASGQTRSSWITAALTEAALTPESRSVAGALHVNSVQTYEAAGLAGLGLIQAGLLGVRHHLDSGALVEVLPDLRPEPLEMAFVVAHRSNLSRRVRTFISWTKDVLAPYLD